MATTDTSAFGNVSFVEIIGRGPDLAGLTTAPSPALKEAKQDFRAIADSIPEEGAPSRFQALRDSLAARRQVSENLGEAALGIEKAAQIVVDPSIALAAQQFTKTATAALAGMDHVEGNTPAPQGLPVAAKGSNSKVYS